MVVLSSTKMIPLTKNVERFKKMSGTQLKNNLANRRCSMAMGTELKVARIRKGETLRGLAERVGVDPGYLSRVENNKTKMSAEVLGRLCRALDVRPDVILEWDKKDVPA
jgi:DNA-binding Xre family transcriptional regulator